MVEMIGRIAGEMGRGNFSLPILIVGVLQLIILLRRVPRRTRDRPDAWPVPLTERRYTFDIEDVPRDPVMTPVKYPYRKKGL